MRISISLAGKTAAESASEVNALAQSYAETYCREWKSSVERAYRDAHEAAGRAQWQFHEATSRLEAFLDRKQQAVREASQRPAPSRRAMVDNPDWVQQDHQLGELRRRRGSAEGSHAVASGGPGRGPSHQRGPTTIGFRAATDRRGAHRRRRVEPAAGPPAALPNPAELQQLQQAVGQATRANEETIRMEQQAWHVRSWSRRSIWMLASPGPAPAPFHSRMSLGGLAALAAGMTIVTGLGMISTGAAIQPSLATVAEFQAVLPVPIVGIIPETDPVARRPGAAAVNAFSAWPSLPPDSW